MSRSGRRSIALLLLVNACRHEALPQRPPAGTPHVWSCPTPPGWSGCVAAEVLVAAPPERVFTVVARIEGLERFFPGMHFRLRSPAPVTIGSRYEVIEDGSAAVYEVTALVPHRRLAAAQVTGPFARFRYDHRFLPVADGTRSSERVWYALPFGWLNPLIDALYVRPRIHRTLREAHHRLAEYFASPPSVRRSSASPSGSERAPP